MNLVEEFEHMIAVGIDETGVHPNPGMHIAEDGTLNLSALDLEPEQIFDWFWNLISVENCQEIIFGLDRSTKKGQGTEFSDVVTCCHWREKWNKPFRIGVINYQHEPRIVRPIDWENQFWIKQMGAEVRQRTPPFRIQVTKEDQKAALTDTLLRPLRKP